MYCNGREGTIKKLIQYTTVSTDYEHICMCHASEDMEAEPIWGASFRKLISEIGTTCRSLSFMSL